MSYENLQLQADFAAAVENPQDFDFGFEKQREESGYANFDFDPVKAKALRDAEIARIDSELDLESDEEEDFEDELDNWEGDDDDDADPFDDDFDDDDMSDDDDGDWEDFDDDDEDDG